MNLFEIKQDLKYGDIQFIAKSSGYSPSLVEHVLGGRRNNKKVIEAAALVAKNNRSLAEQIAIMCEEEVG